jgi:2,4-dienoyl-CoA reductase-like NADH-dependent reductase (Old Yellow Enzyme family)
MTRRAEDVLFTPVSIGTLRLANRIVMAPMTRGFSPDGVPGPDVAAYYERRARGGVGLIVTEGVAINAEGAHSFTAPRLYGDDVEAPWRAVVDRAHVAGSPIMAQLWHVGATRLARDIGFDGVEIHGAHGYLVDQFLWSRTNRRSDRYGGDARQRATFAVELVSGCRAASGPDFPILFRFSQWKSLDYAARLFADPGAMEQVLGPIADAGVTAFHASQRRFWEPAFEGSRLNLAGWAKRTTGRPSITVGSVLLDADFKQGTTERTGGTAPGAVTEDRMDALAGMLERDEIDAVAIGRALIANPDLPEKLRHGATADLRDFDRSLLATLV